VEQAITAPAIQFKGSGWYVTDYAGKSPAKDTAGADSGSTSIEKSEKKESASKESTAKESKDSSDKKAPKKK